MGEISGTMLPAVSIVNQAKTKLPFFRKLLYNVNYLIYKKKQGGILKHGL